MITVEKAKELIKENVSRATIVDMELNQILGYYLAEDIIAPVPIPLFNQSAMDGYAFKFEDRNQTLTIIDEIAAGDTRDVNIKNGETVRIFTGAKVPDSCDTVVMQELTEVTAEKLNVKDEGLKLGGNVRKKGNQITAGEIALRRGAKINAGTIGFLSALGITKVKVHQQPQVTIIATGNELVKPGHKLLDGQIYESNTFMLEAALLKIGVSAQIMVVKDNPQETEEAIKKALATSNIVLLSGGISVGDYDFVKEALEKNNVEEVFYKIKQKPGKPLFFGKTKACYVFALPGNPAAALSCFYEYVCTAINIMKGSLHPELVQVKLPISKPYTKKAGRANFLKGITDFKTVEPLEGQGSDALQSFSLANCLIFTAEETTIINEDELVEIHLLP